MKNNLIKAFAMSFIAMLFASFCQAQDWSALGNAGTNPATNFLGTTDYKAFKIKTNNTTRIRINNNGNVGIGNIVPHFRLDIAGSCNINNELYMGGKKLISLSGSNMFIGLHAGENDQSVENTFIGESAGKSNTCGFHNCFVGFEAGLNSTCGHNNTFVGHQAGKNNTDGTYNTFVGLIAGYGNQHGAGNSCFGQNVLYSNTNGFWNCAFGFESGNVTTSSNNCFFGTGTGLTNTTGASNCFFGYHANANGANYSNSTCIGNTALITSDNQVRIGNSAVTSIGGFADWTNFSDGRFKINVTENIPGLEFVNKLRPVTYNLDVTSIDRYLRKDEVSNSASSSDQEKAAIIAKEKIIYTGLIAQEVEAIAKSLGYEFSGVDVPKNEKDIYGIRYSEFVMPLIKAVQQLSDQNNQLKKDNIEMKNAIESLQNYLLQNDINFKVQNNFNTSDALLEQNIPNPAGDITTIKYFVPEKSGNAFVKISSSDGKELKLVPITNKGFGEIILQAKTFSSGIYSYILIVDGKIIDTKQMVITQ